MRELPPQAVSHYLSQVSLPSLLLGAVHPALPGLLLGPQERTAELDSEADWVFAISKAVHSSIDILSICLRIDWTGTYELRSMMRAVVQTLARQSAYNNIISEALKGVTRIIGWGILAAVSTVGPVLLHQRLLQGLYADLPGLLQRRRRASQGEEIVNLDSIETINE